jgi:hypothetical protein
MKDVVMKSALLLLLLLAGILLVLSLLGTVSWQATFFIVLMFVISLGALAEYRNAI